MRAALIFCPFPPGGISLLHCLPHWEHECPPALRARCSEQTYDRYSLRRGGVKVIRAQIRLILVIFVLLLAVCALRTFMRVFTGGMRGRGPFAATTADA